MDISDFYSWNSKLLSKTLQAHPVYPPLAVKRFRELSKGEYDGIDFPVVFKQEYGSKLEDVLDTGTAMLFLVSEKTCSVLIKNNLTGWKTFDIKLVDKKGIEISGYYGFSVTGKCGSVDYSKCEIIEKQFVPNGPLGKNYKGLYVGLDKWDGSDFFTPEGTYQQIITDKAADIIKKNDLSNIVFTNLSTIETPDFGVPRK